MTETINPNREVMSDEDLRDLRESVREVCARHAGTEEARRLLDGGTQESAMPQLWNGLVTELGVGGLLVPERFGGVDAGWAALRVVLEELGRGLAAAPFVPSNVLAATLLLSVGDDDAREAFLPGIAEGTTVATVAVGEAGSGWDDWTRPEAPAGASVTAAAGPDGWTVSGRKRSVSFGATANLFLVTAATAEGPGIFTIERDANGLTTTALDTLDGTRPVADVAFADTPARMIALGGPAGDAVRRTLDLGGLAIAAEDVGAMRACLEMSVEYAKLRTQFDRPIGSFQAVKHKLADMLVRVELAEAAVEEAALAVDSDAADAAAGAVVAHACAAESFRLVAAETIQTHGGVGFTWEHAAHLYFRRAKASALVFGGATRYRERLLARLGLIG
ncbi:acyl-CoA dehydrogenase family protein [Gordonia polyisoprenivorans]|uniref:acyl-CoA dehydrogenase family protein n=1 Tax=Gordonia polyisoprenivorans TaxID=84595 RepID=UPI001AD63A9B|nr:acyl-CoA dehydrogenase family protein [Gordonia polyisoprenivorans]QTI70947.1 acyl-CoA/acyl-ACP dehydrogenase [Gordonia polyisoprenivorans]